MAPTLDVLPTVLALLLLPPTLWLYTSHMSRTSFPTIRMKRIVFLIAHPDDEAMFFAPTLLALTRPELGNHVKVLCLSSGDADGLGETRKREIRESVRLLGVRSESDCLVLDDPKLPDNIHNSWPTSHITSLLLSTFAPDLPTSTTSTTNTAPTSTIDALITFDKHGVSSHPNHTSCSAGARLFLEKLMANHAGWKCPVALYELRTVNVLRKYSGCVDAVVSVVRAILAVMTAKDRDKRGWDVLSGSGAGASGERERKVLGARESRGKADGGKNKKTMARGEDEEDDSPMPSWLLVVSGVGDWYKALKAMITAHRSQMVWFRWGYIAVGRYMIVNDLTRVKVAGAGR